VIDDPEDGLERRRRLGRVAGEDGRLSETARRKGHGPQGSIEISEIDASGRDHFASEPKGRRVHAEHDGLDHAHGEAFGDGGLARGRSNLSEQTRLDVSGAFITAIATTKAIKVNTSHQK